nr:MAG TPA: Rifin [Caudoviricetes sp.]
MTTIIILSLIAIILVLIIILVFVSNAFRKNVKEMRYKIQFAKNVKFEIFASFRNCIND